jgi:hypothetical protein
MQRSWLLLFIAFLFPLSLFAQSPQGIQFQSVVRDAVGIPMNNATVTLAFRIQNAGGITQYHETHTVTTDNFGLFNVVIGNGTVQAGNFATIDWGSSQHQVDIQVDLGAGFVPLGVCQFESVPYALYTELSMSELTDVNATGLTAGQVLAWNGTEWVPANNTSPVWSQNGTTAFYDLGRVGVGIDTPKAALHLRDTANFLIGDDFTGSGFKMLYYANKGAFRAGYLNNPFGGYNYNKFWDYDSVGYYSWAGGQNSRAKGFGAFAFGSFGWADGSGSVAFFGNARGNNSFTFGGSSKGRGSITFEGVAEDEGGIAMYGYTGGRYGVSIGGGTTGLGASSSRQDYAVAIGWNSDARGQASVALGPSDAYGYNAFSTGWVTEARGNYSSTFGYQTNSYPYASMALGRFNVITGDSASWVNTDPIFMIGDGTSNGNRSNSFMIQKNGQTAIGYNSPTGMLNVSTAMGSLNNGGTLDATNASILIGSTTFGMAFDANQIESIGSTLHLNYNANEDVTLVHGGGNVSIGHTTPLTKLDLEGQGWQFRINNPSVGGTDWFIGSSNDTWAVGGGRFVISPTTSSGNYALVIEDADKQVGIGTNNPTDRLHINSAAGEDALRVQVDGNTRLRVHDNGGVSIGANVGPQAAGLYIHGETEFNGNARPDDDNAYSLGSPAFKWTSVHATNGIIQTSDLRLKSDVEPLEYGLQEVMDMQTIRYQWKDQKNGPSKIGLSAQNLEKIVPEVVTKDESDPESMMGVNYAELVPVLINAVQEQQKQIESLQQEIQQLKSQQP